MSCQNAMCGHVWRNPAPIGACAPDHGNNARVRAHATIESYAREVGWHDYDAEVSVRAYLRSIDDPDVQDAIRTIGPKRASATFLGSLRGA